MIFTFYKISKNLNSIQTKVKKCNLPTVLLYASKSVLYCKSWKVIPRTFWWSKVL